MLLLLPKMIRLVVHIQSYNTICYSLQYHMLLPSIILQLGWLVGSQAHSRASTEYNNNHYLAYISFHSM